MTATLNISKQTDGTYTLTFIGDEGVASINGLDYELLSDLVTGNVFPDGVFSDSVKQEEVKAFLIALGVNEPEDLNAGIGSMLFSIGEKVEFVFKGNETEIPTDVGEGVTIELVSEEEKFYRKAEEDTGRNPFGRISGFEDIEDSMVPFEMEYHPLLMIATEPVIGGGLIITVTLNIDGQDVTYTANITDRDAEAINKDANAINEVVFEAPERPNEKGRSLLSKSQQQVFQGACIKAIEVKKSIIFYCESINSETEAWLKGVAKNYGDEIKNFHTLVQDSGGKNFTPIKIEKLEGVGRYKLTIADNEVEVVAGSANLTNVTEAKEKLEGSNLDEWQLEYAAATLYKASKLGLTEDQTYYIEQGEDNVVRGLVVDSSNVPAPEPERTPDSKVTVTRDAGNKYTVSLPNESDSTSYTVECVEGIGAAAILQAVEQQSASLEEDVQKKIAAYIFAAQKDELAANTSKNDFGDYDTIVKVGFEKACRGDKTPTPPIDPEKAGEVENVVAFVSAVLGAEKELEGKNVTARVAVLEEEMRRNAGDSSAFNTDTLIALAVMADGIDSETDSLLQSLKDINFPFINREKPGWYTDKSIQMLIGKMPGASTNAMLMNADALKTAANLGEATTAGMEELMSGKYNDLLHFPVNVGGNHWVLYTLDVTKPLEPKVIFFDPIKGGEANEEVVNGLLNAYAKVGHIQEEKLKRPKNTTTLNGDQADFSSCGVRVVEAIRTMNDKKKDKKPLKVRNRDFKFTSKKIAEIRKQHLLESVATVNGKLKPEYQIGQNDVAENIATLAEGIAASKGNGRLAPRKRKKSAPKPFTPTGEPNEGMSNTWEAIRTGLINIVGSEDVLADLEKSFNAAVKQYIKKKSKITEQQVLEKLGELFANDEYKILLGEMLSSPDVESRLDAKNKLIMKLSDKAGEEKDLAILAVNFSAKMFDVAIVDNMRALKAKQQAAEKLAKDLEAQLGPNPETKKLRDKLAAAKKEYLDERAQLAGELRALRETKKKARDDVYALRAAIDTARDNDDAERKKLYDKQDALYELEDKIKERRREIEDKKWELEKGLTIRTVGATLAVAGLIAIVVVASGGTGWIFALAFIGLAAGAAAGAYTRYSTQGREWDDLKTSEARLDTDERRYGDDLNRLGARLDEFTKRVEDGDTEEKRAQKDFDDAKTEYEERLAGEFADEKTRLENALKEWDEYSGVDKQGNVKKGGDLEGLEKVEQAARKRDGERDLKEIAERLKANTEDSKKLEEAIAELREGMSLEQLAAAGVGKGNGIKGRNKGSSR